MYNTNNQNSGSHSKVYSVTEPFLRAFRVDTLLHVFILCYKYMDILNILSHF